MSARAALVEPAACTLHTHLVLWGFTALSAMAGIGWATANSAGVASDVLRVFGAAFTGLCAGALAVTRLVLGRSPPAASQSKPT